jgi:prepilin-type processing-associated H-X9-DG protein
LSKAREKARAIACINNLKQCGTAVIMYAGDNDDHLTPGNDGTAEANYKTMDPFTPATIYTGNQSLWRTNYAESYPYCNFGLNFAGGYLSGASGKNVVFCGPASAQYANPLNPPSAYWMRCMTYNYIGGMTWRTYANGDGTHPERERQRITTTKPGAHIMRCSMVGAATKEVEVSVHGKNVANCLYADGHAEAKTPDQSLFYTSGNKILAFDN